MSFLSPLIPGVSGGSAGAILGGIGGFALGGPTGAAAGASLGGGLGGLLDANGNAAEAEANLLKGPIRNISAPGFTSNLEGGALNFQRGDATNKALSGFRDITTGANRELQTLQGEVTPGSSRLTDATRDIFGNIRSDLKREQDQAKGTLRTNLARRGVLGSSFGEDVINRNTEVFKRAERDLALQEEQLTSQNILRDLDTRFQIINQRATILQSQANTEIRQLNLESELAGNIALGASNAITAGAKAIADLEAERAGNLGSLFQQGIAGLGNLDFQKIFGGGDSALPLATASN